MKDLYYTNQENYKIGDSKYPCHMINGIRGRGKSTHWLKEGFERSIKTGRLIYHLICLC